LLNLSFINISPLSLQQRRWQHRANAETDCENQTPLSITQEILNNYGGMQKNSFSFATLPDHVSTDHDFNSDSISYYYSIDAFLKIKPKLNNSFTVLSLNAQCLHAKFEQIKCFLQILADNDVYFDALCFQETWLDNSSDCSQLTLNGYNRVLQGKQCSEHGGLAFYIRANYNYQLLFSESNSPVWEGQFFRIRLNRNKHILLGNIYRPPRNGANELSLFMESFADLLARLNHSRCDTIISGDFNFDLLKHESNTSVKEFLDLITSSGYTPKITIPTRFGRTSATLIDNFLLKFPMHNQEDCTGVMIDQISDHQACFFAFGGQIEKANGDRYIEVTKRSESFFDDVSNAVSATDFMSTFEQQTDVNANCTLFVNTLKEAINTFTTTKICKRNKYKHKFTPWITYGIIRSIRSRDKLYKKMKKSKPGTREFEVNEINLKTFNGILQKAIREAKRSYFYDAFESCKDDARKTWKTINSLRDHKPDNDNLPEFMTFNGQQITNGHEIVNNLNAYFSEIGNKLTESIDSPNVSFETYLSIPAQEAFNFQPITPEQVENIIDKLQPKNSCAADGISSKLLKKIKPYICRPLSFLINQSFQTGRFPNILKVARVKALFKKGDVHDPNNYRPISILPAVSKIFEKAIQKQMTMFFEAHSMFYHSQYGFRSQHSTEFAVLELTDRLSTSMDKGEIPLAIFIDLSKAFDCLSHDILLKKLSYYGFDDLAISLMRDYLCNRQQFIKTSEFTSNLKDLTTGVPQGSILGPLLFLIFMNDFASASDYFDMINFADDTALISTMQTNVSSTSSQTDTELAKISTWLRANKLLVNVNKTKAMIFHTPRRKVPNPVVTLNDERIEIVNKFTYLGIVLDRHLCWNEHIAALASKISQTTGVLNRLKNHLPKYILKLIYDSLIHCRVKYGILVWGACSGTNRILLLQKRAIRAITKAKYNAHCDPIFRNLGILKVVDERKLQELIFYYRFSKSLVPTYFKNNFVDIFAANTQRRTRNSNIIRLPRFRHDFFRKQLRYSIAKTVNESPPTFLDKVQTHSLKGYTCYIKNKLLDSSYNAVCTRRNCYVCNAT
jgi:hypothetical protein